jgi:hypothetical protein
VQLGVVGADVVRWGELRVVRWMVMIDKEPFYGSGV